MTAMNQTTTTIKKNMTWFKPYMSTESVGLAGFCCERKDRLNKEAGE